MDLDLWGLFRKGKTTIIAKFQRTDLLIYCQSRERKTPSCSRINMVIYVFHNNKKSKPIALPKMGIILHFFLYTSGAPQIIIQTKQVRKLFIFFSKTKSLFLQLSAHSCSLFRIKHLFKSFSLIICRSFLQKLEKLKNCRQTFLDLNGKNPL